uniref:Cytochrome P450 family 27 subfamily A member 2 n=1 Tax=Amphilophus citrinellus TaxID=61819 RepID=A0A3Q0SDK4_AMPCI
MTCRGPADPPLCTGCLSKDTRRRCTYCSLYGPIWRSKFGLFDIVNVATPDLIAQVIQQEGRYPVRAELPHWKEYRDLRGQAYGLHVETGLDWYRLRSALNPKMLKLQEVSAYASVIHQVVGDLLQRIELLRTCSQDQATVSDLAAELYKFGFEGVSSILFETRLGCLQEEIPHDTLRFIAAVNDMLTFSDPVLLFPRWSRDILPFWKRFIQAWDDLSDIAQMLIDRRMAEIEAQVSRGEPAEGMYLTYLLSSDKLSKADVYTSVTELMLGGVDTVRKKNDTVVWFFTSVELDLFAFSSTSLYPVVPGNGRYISENEVILDNYWFPKKTQFHLCHYAACHDESEFVDAERFLPERWFYSEAPSSRSNRAMPGFYQHHPYSFIPFGVGVRACVGKRVAEMEMHFALSRLMQHYEIQPEDGAPTVEAKTRTLLIPSKPINLRFMPRA